METGGVTDAARVMSHSVGDGERKVAVGNIGAAMLAGMLEELYSFAKLEDFEDIFLDCCWLISFRIRGRF